MGHAKSRLGLNKDISNTWMKEFEESLGGVGALGHEESLGWEGDSIRLGPRLEELEQSGVEGDDRGNVQGLVSGQKKGYEVDQLVVEGKGIHSPSSDSTVSCTCLLLFSFLFSYGTNQK
ncbi:hypothetical protein ACSQ67_022158 [Phaseolus vulgaris]